MSDNKENIMYSITNIQTGKLCGSTYIKQEPYINENGIYEPMEWYVSEGTSALYKCIITKEMFIEAYNKYIKENKRRKFKGGWKR